LFTHNAIVEGQPEQAMKKNSGYTMLFHAKSTSKKFVYIEALVFGFPTRYMIHSSRPNVAFMEMQNDTEVKVLAVMISDVKAGTEPTVNYWRDSVEVRM
jgi:SET domain-containing protein